VVRKGRLEACAPGRALAFAGDPGWSELVRPLLAMRDAEAPADVLAGIVALLARWRHHWGARPVAVVPMPSREHSRLVLSIAAHIARVGRLPLLEALALRDGPAPDPDAASAARVLALLHGLALRPGVAIPRGPLLLVDACYRSGWSATVAAALLREAGATAVLPLVLHQSP
jgi:ATP-dependent DNA helicase RecQ